MDRRDYTDRVLSYLRRVTAKEREAIRAELDGHIEDHMEALRELGYDEPLAEERTLAAMGDPAEVGRELNEQYPFRWLVAGTIAKALAVVFLCLLVLSLFSPGSDRVAGYVSERLHPSGEGRSEITQTAVLPLDIREQVGDDELRIYQVALGEQETETGAKTGAEVLAVAYDQTLFGTVSSWVLGDMTLENQSGTQTAWCGCDTLLNPDPRILFIRGFVETAPGDTYVTLSQDRFGQSFSLRIPLPEEVTP